MFSPAFGSRSLLCWYVPAVCTAALHKSLCRNEDILCMAQMYLFIPSIYAHIHHTHTQASQGGVFWRVSNPEIFIWHKIWPHRKWSSKTYVSTRCPPTIAHPKSSPLRYTSPHNCSLPSLRFSRWRAFFCLPCGWSRRQNKAWRWLAEKFSLLVTVTVLLVFWMWCIWGVSSRPLSSSHVMLGAGFPVAEHTAVRRPSAGRRGWNSTVSSEIAGSKKRRGFLHSGDFTVKALYKVSLSVQVFYPKASAIVCLHFPWEKCHLGNRTDLPPKKLDWI